MRVAEAKELVDKEPDIVDEVSSKVEQSQFTLSGTELDGIDISFLGIEDLRE